MREMTLDLAEIAQGDQVLDVGCGTGTLTIAAKARAGASGEVHGIDAATEMIEVARRKTVQKGIDVDFQVGLIEDIPFPDDEFDLVLSSLMLHHLPEDLKHRGFVEIRRVLKAGGRFLAVDLELSAHHLFAGLATLFSRQGMVQSNLQSLTPILEEAGFTAVESGRTRFKVVSFLRGRAG
jgi:demethylmenaquinone methyltransferase/2-methoxy-6-polyprenyl-1,4-benzoquinol methylase/phosphoethanolamine N-methyltransferase